jgi:Domain of unknown function (DUF4153)
VLALRVVVHPLADLARTPTQLFLLWWPVGLVVPLVLLVIALWQRVDTYGVTPERYALGLFALFLGLVLLAQVSRSTRGDIRIIPALGALALFLGSFGPWGMFGVSARSQMARLMRELADAGAIENGVLVDNLTFSRGAAEDMRSIVRMLVQIRQSDRLAPLFAGRPDDPFREAGSPSYRTETTRIWEALNVKELPPLPGDVGRFAVRSGSGAVSISGYDLVLPSLVLARVDRPAVSVGGGAEALSVRTDTMKVEIAGGGTTFTVDGNVLRDQLQERLDTVETLPDSERPPFFAEVNLDGRRVGLLFRSVDGKITETEVTLTSGVFDLYLRRADWQDASGGEAGGRTEP